jgi:NarL family two-component system response regulator LiaR
MTAEKPPIQVLIAEDHKVTRLGIRMFLESTADIKVIAEAADGDEAAKLADEMRPDVVLMDVQMPNLDGIASARKIKQHMPTMKIVMMTSSSEEQDVFASLAAGASGYCTKEISDDRLLIAIRAVHAGDIWLDANIATQVLNALPRPAAPANTSYQLSEREMDVLRLIVDGMNNQQISTRLFISLDTVKTHIKHILEKLAVSDRTQAAVKALREQIV